MLYETQYHSPIGEYLLVSDGKNLVGVWTEGQRHYFEAAGTEPVSKEDIPVLMDTKDWLDRYFAGEKPSICELALAPQGNEFRQTVWKFLCEIPYGETTTYGAIARKTAKAMGKERMSAQAVGGAVGHNPISIIIPCHRVIGKDGSLVGYGGGLDRKRKLLELEGVAALMHGKSV